MSAGKNAIRRGEFHALATTSTASAAAICHEND